MSIGSKEFNETLSNIDNINLGHFNSLCKNYCNN